MNQTEKLILVENLLLSLRFFLSLSLTTETIFYFKSYFIMRPIVFFGSTSVHHHQYLPVCQDRCLEGQTFGRKKRCLEREIFGRADVWKDRASEGEVATFTLYLCNFDVLAPVWYMLCFSIYYLHRKLYELSWYLIRKTWYMIRKIWMPRCTVFTCQPWFVNVSIQIMKSKSNLVIRKVKQIISICNERRKQILMRRPRREFFLQHPFIF